MEVAVHKFTHQPGKGITKEEAALISTGFVVALRRDVPGGQEHTYAKLSRVVIDGKPRDVVLLPEPPPADSLSTLHGEPQLVDVKLARNDAPQKFLYGVLRNHKFIVVGSHGKSEPVQSKKKSK